MGCINVKKQSFQQLDKLSLNSVSGKQLEVKANAVKEKEEVSVIEEHQLLSEPSDKEKRIFIVPEEDTQKQDDENKSILPVLQIKNLMETNNKPFKFLTKLQNINSQLENKTESLKNEDESTNVFDWKERSVLQIKFKGFVQAGERSIYRVEGYYLNN